MIFVTVGGMHGFERLVREMDRIAGKLDEQVVMQVGTTDCKPTHCDYHRFMPVDEMEKLYAGARLVVCHAGIGSILTALKYSKPLVLVPRMKKHGEHIDDHQLEIAREMENRGIAVVYDVTNLESMVKNLDMSSLELKGETGLVDRLRAYLDRLEQQP